MEEWQRRLRVFGCDEASQSRMNGEDGLDDVCAWQRRCG